MHLVHEVLELTVSCLSNIGQQTVLELLVTSELLVRWDLILDLLPKLMLISEHISDFTGVDWHAALVSKVHCALLVDEPILHGIILLLGQLRHLLEVLVRAGLIDDVELDFAAKSHLGCLLVLQEVDQSALLTLFKGRQHWHKALEAFLVSLMLLEGCLREVVQCADLLLELIRRGVILGEDLLWDVLLIVELSDLLLGVKLLVDAIAPWSAVKLFKELHLGGSHLWGWVFSSL